jgi:hypothetical protein
MEHSNLSPALDHCDVGKLPASKRHQTYAHAPLPLCLGNLSKTSTGTYVTLL